MSSFSQHSGHETGAADGSEHGADERRDSLPVLAEEARLVRAEMVAGELLPARQSAAMPAVQAAAAAGFVAGAAVVGLVTRRRRSAALARGRRAGGGLARGRRRGGAGELVQIVGSRSLLLDVHLLGGRD